MLKRLLHFFPFLGSPKFWLGLWGAWFVTLFVLSSMSHPIPEIPVRNIDKLEHVAVFAAGGLVLTTALLLRGKSGLTEAWRTADWKRTALLVVLAGAVVGWFDEWHQTFTPGRSGLDFRDWLADITGSVLATPLTWACMRLIVREKT